jgi:hypothetical protein
LPHWQWEVPQRSRCWSGSGNDIAISKVLVGGSPEFVVDKRSNPSGDMFDMTSARSVGMSAMIEGQRWTFSRVGR